MLAPVWGSILWTGLGDLPMPAVVPGKGGVNALIGFPISTAGLGWAAMRKGGTVTYVKATERTDVLIFNVVTHLQQGKREPAEYSWCEKCQMLCDSVIKIDGKLMLDPEKKGTKKWFNLISIVSVQWISWVCSHKRYGHSTAWKNTSTVCDFVIWCNTTTTLIMSSKKM